MMVVNNTAVRTNRNINAGFIEIFVPCFANINKSGCLTAADTLGLTGDADRSAADTNLNKVSTCLCKEEEAIPIDNISGTDLNAVAVLFTDKGDCS